MADDKAKLEAHIEMLTYMVSKFPDDPQQCRDYGRQLRWAQELYDIKYPKPLPKDDNIVSLDDHRIRTAAEFEDEQMAYLEALWGKESFAFNVAIRDLEAVRRGSDDKALRPPETYHEALHMVLHVRSLANDLARHFGLDDLVRPVDDLHPATEEKVVKVDLTSPTALEDLEQQLTDKEEP
jgi:hypothetical protein